MRSPASLVSAVGSPPEVRIIPLAPALPGNQTPRGQGGRSQGLDTVSLALPTARQGCEDSRQGWDAGGPGLGADTWGDWMG